VKCDLVNYKYAITNCHAKYAVLSKINFVIQVLDNELLCGIYESPNIISIMKSRRLQWSEHVDKIGRTGSAYTVLAKRPCGKWPHGR
jgi:hypothetical protein